VLLVDKPAGITSHDLVDALRRIYRIRAVGHTGTLDPTASGLMIMLFGKGTKIAPFVTSMSKCYHALIHLGWVSDSGDAEGRLTQVGDSSALTQKQVEKVVRSLTGDVSLKVPALAAVHTGGKRRYELTRAGRDVPSLERCAAILSADLLAFDNPAITIRVRCSAGTYIRSYAERIGEVLGCGAYLSGLRREEIGPWHVHEAVSLSELKTSGPGSGQPPPLRTIGEFLTFAKARVFDDSVQSVAMGRPVVAGMIADLEGQFISDDTVLLCDTSGHALAVVTALFDSDKWPVECPPGGLFSYRRVLI
jgi:tRNA pseudouridine55 synthase